MAFEPEEAREFVLRSERYGQRTPGAHLDFRLTPEAVADDLREGLAILVRQAG